MLKLKVSKFGWLNPKSLEVTGDKSPPPLSPPPRPKKKMNRVKEYGLLDTGLEENGFL